MVEVRQFDQYVVRVDGSGRVTLRNRKFLRKFSPVYSPHTPHTLDVDIRQDNPPQRPMVGKQPERDNPPSPSALPLTTPTANEPATQPPATERPLDLEVDTHDLSPSPSPTTITTPGTPMAVTPTRDITTDSPIQTPPRTPAPPTPTPRRSNRIRKPSTYLKDYKLGSE